MNIFMIARQLVDILHEFIILDYAIVLFAFGLFLYRFISKKIYKNLKEYVIWADLIVLLLMVVYTLTIIRHPENSYKQYIKTISAFALYFLGRVYGKDVVNNVKGITTIAYLIIYVNGIYRIIEYVHEKTTGEYMPTQTWDFKASGAFYFYKTDLVIGIIIATIFIYTFAKNNWFKYITILLVVPMITFTTSARMCQMIFVFEYILMFVIWAKNKWGKSINPSHKAVNAIFIILAFVITVAFVALQYSPIHRDVLENILVDPHEVYVCEKFFHARHYVWWDALNYFSNKDFITRAIGIDLWSESLLNSHNDRFHCLYMKMIYSVGYIGCYLFLAFLYFLVSKTARSKETTLKHLTVAFWTMFLLIGWSMEAFEYPQMSWFPFLFAGAIMSKDLHKS